MINKRLFRESKIKRTYLPAIVLISVFNSAFIIINAYILSKIVNMLFIEKIRINMIKSYLFLFLSISILKSAVNTIFETCIKNCSEEIKESIKSNLFRKMLSTSPLSTREIKSGELINLVTDGFESLTPYYSQYIPQFAAVLIIPAALCIGAAAADRLSALIMLITYPLIPLFMILIGYKSREANEKQWKRLDILSSHFIDMLQGLRVLKAFGRDKLQVQKIFEAGEDYRRATMEVLRISFLSAMVLEGAATICAAVLAVNLGMRLVYSKINFLNAFFILLLAPDYYMPMRQLGLKFHSSLNGEVVAGKLEELERKIKSDGFISGELSVGEGPIEIEARNLSFSHSHRENLNNISFRIRCGEKVAVVGRSGSGKSTLLNILCGFLKVEEGRVLINGIDINYINKKNYLDKVAVIPQFPHIFNASIEKNVLLNSKMKNVDEILKIYELTGILQFSGLLEDSVKTSIGDGEETQISGGEKQRIAAARALVKEAELIILDEPSSALDSETEGMIEQIIKNRFKNKTVLIAAHRLNTIRNADRILVLNEGALVEEGTHDALMLKKGWYYNLIKTSEEEL